MTIAVNVSEFENKVTLGLFGRLDTTTAPNLQKELMGQIEEGLSVELDFAELKYVSSAGLRVLLMGEKAAKSKDISMKLINVSDEIMEVFDMTGFANVLQIEGAQ
ncbi:MAG: STAS domain-containing protein [Oscillospiraceae bacterium]|nr:STAS domain-containing protein [Oscillospiraceae bacterium]